MTEVLHSPSSSSSPSISTPTHNAALFHQTTQSFVGDEAISMLTVGDAEERQEENSVREKRENDRREQLSILALLVDLFRKSFWLTCKTGRENFAGTSAGGVMEISWPTDVEHVNHVTFDRFDGFLGLPVEFEPEVLRRAPSASATVFGVSTESMQLSYDQRGNSIPTILLLMQRHLYSRGGLQVEGIFRITAGNSQEEYVRDHLNRGVVPDGIDVHCLGGLIKAWFRELPTGVLDSLSSEQVMQCQSEEDCAALVRLLPPTEAALLDWVINLMADVVQEEHRNKMNARNIAMVFAPNMTQMADPLTALMYAVQVMNFLKTLIEKTLREREEPLLEPAPVFDTEHHPDDNGHQSSLHKENPQIANEQQTVEATFVVEHPETADSASETNQVDHNVTDEDSLSCYSTSAEESDANGACGTPSQVYRVSSPSEAEVTKDFQNLLPNPSKFEQMKNKGVSNVTRINSVTERYESLW